MKTDSFFSLTVSYFWLSDTCQGCSDWVLDTSGEMVKLCLQQRGEQGNSGKHTCMVWSDQSLPPQLQSANSKYQPMLQRSGSRSDFSKVSASPIRKCSHKTFPSHAQQPGGRTWVWFGSRSTLALLRLQAHTSHRELNWHFGSQQGRFNWFTSGTGSTLFNTISEVTSEEWERNPSCKKIFQKCFKT